MSQANQNRFLSLAFVAFVLLISACGKNAPNAPYGGYMPVAPAPQGQLPYYGGYGPGSGGYPYGGGQYPYGGMGGYPYGSPYGYGYPGAQYPYYFNPQMPSGYPSQYTPFLPLDNYFRNNPQYGQPYWNALWNQWYQTANHWGVSPYDFPVFWNEYCPQVMRSGQEYGIYVTFQQNFYSWAQPGVEVPTNVNPNSFWIHYLGVIY